MHKIAEIVRSVLRWSLTIVAIERRDNNKFPGPKISQFCLGHLLSRTDFETCEAIAHEISEIEKTENMDEHMLALIHAIRTNWGAMPSNKHYRVSTDDSIIIASEVCSTLKRFGTSSQRDLLEMGSVVRSWKKLESELPGHSWKIIRIDFERSARQLYNGNRELMCKAAEHIVRHKSSMVDA